MTPPPLPLLRERLRTVVNEKQAQGHDADGLQEELIRLPDRYDALYEFGRRLAGLPLRPDWPYREPTTDWQAVCAECALDRPQGRVGTTDPEAVAARVESAFIGSVCGCILGKPLEIRADLYEIRAGLEASGQWPLRDYISERTLEAIGRRHVTWREATREHLRWVTYDDDLTYPVLGMVILERYGTAVTTADIRDAWLDHLPITAVFGPERTQLLQAGIHTLQKGDPATVLHWADQANPLEEFCGALIRADAYGYACPGNPALAAELAWRDAVFTHRRTGVYGAMFIAALLACAAVGDADDPSPARLEPAETALQFVPQKSRFHAIVSDALQTVRESTDFYDAYNRIHAKYGEYGHCRVFQETGTLLNTLRWAESVGDGICRQVLQGNDADSFGARAGAVLGILFGPGHLEPHWLTPFHDEIRTDLARFPAPSLSALAQRMGRLPATVARFPEGNKENWQARTPQDSQG